METIDDDCDSKGVHFVKIADPAAAYHYGITTLPTLVYFKNSVPNLFDGESPSLVQQFLSYNGVVQCPYLRKNMTNPFTHR